MLLNAFSIRRKPCLISQIAFTKMNRTNVLMGGVAVTKKSKGILGHIFDDSDEGRSAYTASVTLSVLGMLCNVVPYMSVYFIVGIFLTQDTNRDASLFWIILSGLAIGCNLLFSYFGSLGCHKVAFRVLYRYRMKLMKHLGGLPLGFFSGNTSGNIQKIMDDNIERLEGVIAHMIPDLIGSFVVFLSLFLGIAYLNLIMAFAVLFSVVLAFFFQFMVFGGEKAKATYGDYMRLSADITGKFSEYVKGMAEVKLFGRTTGISKGLEDNLDECLAWELKNYKKSAFFMSMYKSLILSLLTIVVPVGGFLILSNPDGTTVRSVIMALIVVPSLYEPLLTCIDYATQMNFVGAGLMQIDGILNKPLFHAEENCEKREGSTVVFDAVSFSYESGENQTKKMALDHVGFSCNEGQMTALVGVSGSGKSTIGQLLLRFWDVNEGSIKIGGKDIRSIPTEELMGMIAFVFQDTHIFADTVRANISMNMTCSDEELVDAAKKARCHDFIMRLPKGYDTVIGSGSIKLSGGEAQRISIARAFLKNSEIVILDEALAYTDAENENLIQEAMRALIQDKTVIVIAHRLKSIMDAEKIIVLQDGKIIEEGRHDALMAAGGEYKTLWDLQFEAESWELDGRGGSAA